MLRRVIGFFVFIFLPIFVLAQGAENIVVPPGYQVRKIASTNSTPDMSCWAFDSSSDDIIAGTGAYICRINQTGEVEILCRTRRYGFGVTGIAPSSDGSFLTICTSLTSPTRYSIYRYLLPDQFILTDFRQLWSHIKNPLS